MYVTRRAYCIDWTRWGRDNYLSDLVSCIKVLIFGCRYHPQTLKQILKKRPFKSYVARLGWRAVDKKVKKFDIGGGLEPSCNIISKLLLSKLQLLLTSNSNFDILNPFYGIIIVYKKI